MDRHPGGLTGPVPPAGARARGATAADLPVLVELMARFYDESSYPLDRAWAAASFATLLGRPELGAVWLLLDGAAPAGYVVLTVRHSMEYGGMDAFIDDLFVDAGHRRRGLASRALDAVFAECERRGVLALHVEVGSDDPAALALYARRGLAPRPDGRRTLTTRLGGSPPAEGATPQPATALQRGRAPR